MSTGSPREKPVQVSVPSEAEIDRAEVAEQLQQLYEDILNGKRPEAVGSTERLAEQLDIEIKRPQQFPERVRR